MSRTESLRKMVVTLVAFTALTAQAAVVEINSEGYSLTKKVTGTYVKSTELQFKQGGKYALELTNLGNIDEFTSLAASISAKGNPQKKIAEIALDNGVPRLAERFDLLAGGDYIMTLIGVTSSKLPLGQVGQFKVAIDTVPLPSAVIFLSSALMGLVAFMRRKVRS